MIEKKHREIIHEEGDALFLIKGVKRYVKLNTIEDMATISKYLNFDVKLFLEDYNPLIKCELNPEMVLGCYNLQSLTASYYGDMNFGIMNSMGLGSPEELWEAEKRKAIPLDVFMNPEEYSEYFI